ncbi:hypothetical protein [Microlunatus parietis]|uniref:Uncharacterized membrane protein YraQ (UPF0718 family) n=1 Tax=Microlunatus parietis TaxID=682979 RepID=A0A7Y9I5R9_9ACTN|nr:hypothetical protein [Microlunatus parietis]NYE70779.1 uncharacterized membrane protein YraQ (UPF0718 family) [Microlunatus parietis]
MFDAPIIQIAVAGLALLGVLATLAAYLLPGVRVLRSIAGVICIIGAGVIIFFVFDSDEDDARGYLAMVVLLSALVIAVRPESRPKQPPAAPAPPRPAASPYPPQGSQQGPGQQGPGQQGYGQRGYDQQQGYGQQHGSEQQQAYEQQGPGPSPAQPQPQRALPPEPPQQPQQTQQPQQRQPPQAPPSQGYPPSGG